MKWFVLSTLLIALIVLGTGFTVASPSDTLPAASTTLYPVADAWVNYTLPASNYGTATTMFVGSEECPGIEFPSRGRALVRFDLSAIPSGQAIQSASL